MKKILNDIKTFKGNVLTICVDDNKLVKELRKNNKINIVDFSRQTKRKIFSKKKKFKYSKGKSVKIKKFRKAFKKKSIDYVIIDLNNIFDYYKYMTSNSIYICKNKIYIYGSSDYMNASLVAQKFERYNTTIEKIQDNDDYLVIVDCKKAKYNYFKEKFYLVIDSLHNLGDMISYFLTS